MSLETGNMRRKGAKQKLGRWKGLGKVERGLKLFLCRRKIGGHLLNTSGECRATLSII